METNLLVYFILGTIIYFVLIYLFIRNARYGNRRSTNIKGRKYRLHSSPSSGKSEADAWLELYNIAKAQSLTIHPNAIDQAKTITQPLPASTTEYEADKTQPVASPTPKSLPKPTFESPLEELFWNEWQMQGGADLLDLTYQHWISLTNYRVDFAHLSSKTAIELDGYTYHSTEEQLTHDKKRERDLARTGWRVIRFSGAELRKSPAGCLQEVIEIIAMNNPTAR